MSNVKGFTNTASAGCAGAVNTVPEGWKQGHFGDLAKVQNGYAFKSSDFADVGYAAAIRMSNLKLGRIDLSDAKYVQEHAITGLEQFKLAHGDFLFGMSGSLDNFAWIGKHDGLCYLNQRVGCLRTKPKADPLFASYCYLSETVKREITGLAAGAAQLNISGAQLEAISVPIPPLPEQQKIAAILSSVDDVIEKTRAQIDKLKDLKTGMMQELLTKGIGADGKPHTEFKDSPVGRIPATWSVLALDRVVSQIIDCEHKTAPYVEKSEYLVVRTCNVRDGQLVHDDMKFTTKNGFDEWTKRATPSAGDVLFTREAPAGESCMVPESLKVCMGQRMVLLRPDSDKVDPNFFSLFLNSEIAELAIYELSIGTTVTRINIEDIKRIPCLVPPIKEQRYIYYKVQSIQSLITAKESLLYSQRSIKTALMQDLLTGKVRVNVEDKEAAVG